MLNIESYSIFFLDQRFLCYRFGAPEAILCQSVSVCQQLASFLQTLFNSPFLSSETKSLSLTLTAKTKSKAPHPLMRGRRVTPVLFIFPLIHRRDGMHVQVWGCLVLLILCGIVSALGRLCFGLQSLRRLGAADTLV